MIRILLVFIAALVTAGIIHIGTIFSVPYFSTQDAWHRVLSLGPLHRVHPISSPQDAIALSEDLDPTFVYGVCRVDVSLAPILLKGILSNDFWSLNYIDRLGRSQFSLTNDTSGASVNVLLATKGQQRLLTERPDLIDETAIVIQASENQGILFLRAMVPSERDRQRTSNAIRRLDCAPLWDPQTFE